MLKMATIQSTDVNSYVRSLLDKVMDHNAEQDEAIDSLAPADEGPQTGIDGVAEKKSDQG